MRNLNTKKDLSLFLQLMLCSFGWLAMYGIPDLLGVDSKGALHVLIEGAAALMILPSALLAKFPERAGGKPRRAALAFAVIVAVPFVHASAQMFGLRHVLPPVEDPVLGFTGSEYMWYALRTCVTAPLMEELGCRWLMFAELRRYLGFGPAALFSSCMFSMIHVEVDPALAVMVIPLSLLLCLIYEVTGKLYWCVAVHAVYNLMCLPGMPWTAPDAVQGLYGVQAPACVHALMAVTAIVFLLCSYRNDLFFKKDPASGARHGGAGSAPSTTA